MQENQRYGLLSSDEIIRQGLITPALDRQSDEDPSYGVSPYGYDIRLGDEFIEWKGRSLELDPLAIEEDDYMRVRVIDVGPDITIPPHGFLLGHSVEWISLPDDITGLVKDKSTYARCGIAVQNTVLEAGWSGQITLEITNHNSIPVKLYIGRGIAQVVFFKSPYKTSYPYRGKYMGQKGVVLPRHRNMV